MCLFDDEKSYIENTLAKLFSDVKRLKGILKGMNNVEREIARIHNS